MSSADQRTTAESGRDSAHGQLFESKLLSGISELIDRMTSHHFQVAHAKQLENDLDFTANKILYVLGSLGPSRPSSLAAQLATGRPNVSKAVKRMTADGLLVALNDPNDTRATLIALTDEGIQRSHDVFSIGDIMVKELTEDWTAAEVEQFSGLLARLNAAAAAYEARLNSLPE